MKNSRMATPTTSPRTRSAGTAVLGRVVPEYAVCGVFNVTDTDAKFIADSIAKRLLMHFQIELLQAAGLLGSGDQ